MPASSSAVRRTIVLPVILLLAFGALIASPGVASAAGPKLKITGHPGTFAKTSAARFTFKASRGSKLACALDSRKFTACKSGIRVTAANGRHTYQVRATLKGKARVARWTWTVDTVKPTVNVTGITQVGGSGALATAAGTTWVNTTAAGQLEVTAAAGDGGSGVKSVSFPDVDGAGSAWTPAGSADSAAPYVLDYSWSAHAGGPTGAPALTVTDRAGNSATAPLALDVDTSAPTGTIAALAAAVRGTVAVSGTTADAASGVASARLLYAPDAGGSSSVCTGLASGPWSCNVDTTALADGPGELRLEATDAVGNTAVVASRSLVVDNTGPVITFGSWSGLDQYDHADGSHLYVSGSHDIQATLGVDVSDVSSAVASVQFPDLDSAAGGWAPDGATDTTAPYSVDYTYTGTATDPAGVTITATDAVGNVSTADVFDVTVDSSGPTGLSLTTPTGYTHAASVDLDLDPGTDSVGLGRWRLQHQAGTLAGNTCTYGGGFVDLDPESPSSPYAATVADGTCEQYDLVVFDNVENSSQLAGSGELKVDQSPPDDPTTSAGLAWADAVSWNVSASSSDAVTDIDHLEYILSTDGGSTWSAPVDGDNVDVTHDGETLVEFRAWDLAGNHSGWSAPVSVQLDRSAPADPVVSGGSFGWIDGMRTITASGAADAGVGGVQYEYELSTNSGFTWSAPQAGSSVDVSADGETMVRFRATDALGHQGAWVPAPPTADSLARIDTLPPSAPVVSGDTGGWLAAASQTVSASGSVDAGSGVLGYQWSTNIAGPWTDGDSIDVTDEGTTDVWFRAVDILGHASTPTGVTVQLDTSSPTPPTVSGGNAPGWGNVPGVTVSASGGTDSVSSVAGYEWTTDGGATTMPGDSVDITDEGVTGVQFRSIDDAGNTSAWSAVDNASTVQLDLTAPDTPMLSPGTAWVDAAMWTITASGAADTGGSGLASAGNGYEYRTRLDGGAWSSWTAGDSIDVTNEGSTDVEVRTVDNAGSTSGTASETVQLDRSAPDDPTLTGDDDTNWYDTHRVVSASSTDSGSGVAGYEYQVSADAGATWGPPTPIASDTWDDTDEGVELVRFHAVDGLGHTSGWTVGTAMVDQSDPTDPTVAGGTQGAWTEDVPVTVWASGSTDAGSGVDHYQYRTDTNGGGWTAPVDGSAVMVSEEGTTLVQFRAVDGVGHMGAWAPAVSDGDSTVQVDTRPPARPVVSGGSASWQQLGLVQLTATTSDSPGSGIPANAWEVRESSDGGTSWGSWSPSASNQVSIVTDGDWAVQFRVADTLGHVSSPSTVTASSRARLDTTGPSPAIVLGGSSSWSGSTVTLSAVSGDGGSGLAASGWTWWRSNTGVGTPTSNPPGWIQVGTGLTDTLPVSTDQDNWYIARPTDNVGNVGTYSTAAAPGSDRARVDLTSPTLAPSGGDAAWHDAYDVVLSANAADPAPYASGVASVQFRYSLDGGISWSAPVVGNAFLALPDGEWLVQWRATDNVGNTSAWSSVTTGSTARVDTTAPTQPTVGGSDGAWHASVMLTASSSDLTSGVDPAGWVWEESDDNGGVDPWTPVLGSSSTLLVDTDVDGWYRVTATDVAGNPSTASASIQVRVDTQAPSVDSGSVVVDDCAAGVDGLSALGSDIGSGLDVATWEWKVEGPDPATTQVAGGAGNPDCVDTSGWASGTYHAYWRVSDLATNQSPWTAGGADIVIP